MITEELLDNLARVESNNDPKAVNPKSGAKGLYQFIDSTTEMLHKMGHKFDPMNGPQSREAARFYLNYLVDRNKGDLDKALAQYGGHKTKDPTDYIRRVKGTTMANDSLDSLINDALKGSKVKAQKPSTLEELINSAYGHDSDVPKVVTDEDRAENAARQKEPLIEEVKLRETPIGFGQSAGEVIKKVGGSAIGAGEAALSLGTGIVGQLGGPIVGGVREILGAGKATHKGAEQKAGEFAKGITYMPRTQAGQAILEAVGKAAEAAKLPPYIPIGGYIQQKVAGRGEVKKQVENLDFTLKPQGGSVGAQGVPIKTRVQESLNSASPVTLEKVANVPLKDIDYRAVNRQNLADKYGYTLTEGQSKADIGLRSDEYNIASKFPEIQARLFAERDGAIENGFLQLREKYTPDIYRQPNPHNGQILIDDVQARFKAAFTEPETAAWNATKAIMGNQLKYDNQKLARAISDELKKNGLTYFVPGEVKALMRGFTEVGVSNFDNYDAIRTVLSRIQRSSPDGNVRQAAGIIRTKLEQLDFKTNTPEAKAMLDKARRLTREKYAFLERNPLIKSAVDDIRTADEIAGGILHPAADTIIAQNVLGTGGKASTNQTQHLINFLRAGSDEFGDRGLQALRTSLFDFFENQGFGTGQRIGFREEAFAKALQNPKLEAKFQTILDGGIYKDLADIAAFSKMTGPVPKGGHANVSNTFRGDIGRVVQSMTEQAVNLKTGGIGGTLARTQLERFWQAKRKDRALQPSFTYKNINLGKDAE